MSDNNKVKFGLRNVYYAIATFGENNTVDYGTPKPIPGAVNMSLEAQGETTPFYADDGVYYSATMNDGYSGDLEVAKIPDSFYEDVFGFVADAKGIRVEDAAAEPARFALLFEFKGDKTRTRNVFYNCAATRPAVASSTTSNTKDPITETLSINAFPLPETADGMAIVKGKCTPEDAAYDSWFTAVQTYTPVSGGENP